MRAKCCWSSEVLRLRRIRGFANCLLNFDVVLTSDVVSRCDSSIQVRHRRADVNAPKKAGTEIATTQGDHFLGSPGANSQSASSDVGRRSFSIEAE